MRQDYIGHLRAHHRITPAQYLAAEILRRYAEAPQAVDAMHAVYGPRRPGARDHACADRVDRRRRVMWLMAALPDHVRPVVHAVVIQGRSLREIEPRQRRRAALLADLRHGLDVLAEAMLRQEAQE